jgi:hypothetical protein
MPICFINLKEINHLHNLYGWHKIVIDEFMQKKGQIEVKDEDPCASIYTPFPKTPVHTFHTPFPTLTVIILPSVQYPHLQISFPVPSIQSEFLEQLVHKINSSWANNLQDSESTSPLHWTSGPGTSPHKILHKLSHESEFNLLPVQRHKWQSTYHTAYTLELQSVLNPCLRALTVKFLKLSFSPDANPVV